MISNNKQFLLAISLIIIAVLLRFLELIPNFSPVTAIALLGGAYLVDKRWSVIITISSLLIGDILLAQKNGYPFIHNTIFFVYFSYLLIVFLGWKLQSTKINFLKVSSFAIISSLLFFIISNFGVWIVGTLYERNFDGLIKCFTMAIPFYKYTLIGDLFYAISFFLVYNLIQNTFVHNPITDK